MGVKDLATRVNSRVVANQINGSYVAKEEAMVQYLAKAKALIEKFRTFSIKQVPRSQKSKQMR